MSFVPLSRDAMRAYPAIEEDSTLFKACTCIPLVGIFFTISQEQALGEKIGKVLSDEHLIELINVKNQYKAASVVRNLISCALVVTGIAFGLLNGVFWVNAVVFLGLAGLNIYYIHQNNQKINELRSSGFRSGMAVH